MTIKLNQAVLSCQGLKKVYQDANGYITVLDGVDFDVYPSESVAIVGRSGSGKTTLINLLGGLEMPTEGSVLCENQAFKNLSDRKRGYLRNRVLGLIFQFHHLLPEFTALENVAMPLLIRDLSPRLAKRQAQEALDRVGLTDRVDHKPSTLSGGERQRVAIARAFVTKPKCILADEPTGNLDDENAAHIYQLMRDLMSEIGTSFIVVTHDMQLAQRMDRIVRLEKGKLLAIPKEQQQSAAV
jgi:lipoprotein-releasing system ATP-binding protein